jgi:hypothetical protein
MHNWKKLSSILAVAGLSFFAARADAVLVITEVMSSSAHAGGTNNADWWELTNTGPGAVNLAGYTWNDDNGTPIGITPPPGPATFGSITSIAVGESIVISEETIGADASFRSDWSLPVGVQSVNLGAGVVPGLGSGGDAIVVYNNLNQVVASVTFSASTAGVSFEWDRNGNSLGLSVAGENGAYVATSNGQTTGLGAGVDVGSPGVSVVPEPASMGMMMLGVVGMLVRRRRSN